MGIRLVGPVRPASSMIERHWDSPSTQRPVEPALRDSPFDRFSKLALLELLGGSLDVHRLKGVFNVGTEWLLFNRVGGDLTCESIPYCRDSRVEVILDQPCFNWDEFEKSLLKCLK